MFQSLLPPFPLLLVIAFISCSIQTSHFLFSSVQIQMSFQLAPLSPSLKSLLRLVSHCGLLPFLLFGFPTCVILHIMLFACTYCVLKCCRVTSSWHPLLTHEVRLREKSLLCLLVNLHMRGGLCPQKSSCSPSNDFALSRSFMIYENVSDLFLCSLRPFPGK